MLLKHLFQCNIYTVLSLYLLYNSNTLFSSSIVNSPKNECVSIIIFIIRYIRIQNREIFTMRVNCNYTTLKYTFKYIIDCDLYWICSFQFFSRLPSSLFGFRYYFFIYFDAFLQTYQQIRIISYISKMDIRYPFLF